MKVSVTLNNWLHDESVYFNKIIRWKAQRKQAKNVMIKSKTTCKTNGLKSGRNEVGN